MRDFPPTWRLSFSISRNAGILETQLPHQFLSFFFLSENVFILSQFLRNIFAYRMLADFSIINLKMSFSLLALECFWWAHRHHLYCCFPIYTFFFFFLAAFKIPFYILSFIHLTLMFPGMAYSVFILLGFSWSSWFCLLGCFQQIRRVWGHFFFPSAPSLKFYWEHQLSVFYYCCLRNQWDSIQ